MSKRSARPGMPASPNQQIVLDELKAGCDEKGTWLTIDGVHFRLVLQKRGGHTQEWTSGRTEWKPWHRSTVRDHLNDLAGKALVEKRIIERKAAYRPVDNV